MGSGALRDAPSEQVELFGAGAVPPPLMSRRCGPGIEPGDQPAPKVVAASRRSCAEFWSRVFPEPIACPSRSDFRGSLAVTAAAALAAFGGRMRHAASGLPLVSRAANDVRSSRGISSLATNFADAEVAGRDQLVERGATNPDNATRVGVREVKEGPCSSSHCCVKLQLRADVTI